MIAVLTFAPIVVFWITLLVVRPAGREIAAIILSTVWNLVALTVVNAVAVEVGWWSFPGGGLPVELLIAWAVLWGAIPAHIGLGHPLPLVVGILAWIDLAFMPQAGPVVTVHATWLYGETVAILVALVPGLLLARWTVAGTRLRVRVAAQVLLAGAVMLGLPLAITGAWSQPAWAISLLVQVLAPPCLLGVAAVREFAVAGSGTPLPFDPPERLVTSGPYAYVRNPMQASIVVSYLILAVVDVRFLAGAATAFAYGAGLAAWHEGNQLRARFGRSHDGVRAWVPGLRPYPGMPSAVVYLAETCGECGALARWLVRRKPVALRVAAAEGHPGRLRRMRYERGDGLVADGVAAFANAVQHVHLGWACAGWFLLLPGVGWFAQVAADAFGAGPRDLPVREE
ncbi:hypothetical protein Aple_037670 [Acrocarpospora pleiomorpha]|uniref:Phospholipid methyltransferase n=1 Tax=Acrocarpospora pleiomorpha TaxID=90975 RepID=A0A5M3XMJ6_9ACTN|nr:isoprenylcysteine carboxylmethyltransferase family protein [Acrocarpospora pleiomorpha]GES20871.1 hypothetical protein Aple_037670 [Acrocarpospora pleiomorpha]